MFLAYLFINILKISLKMYPNPVKKANRTQSVFLPSTPACRSLFNRLIEKISYEYSFTS